MTAKATIATVAFVNQWIAVCRAFNHGIEFSHISFASIICQITIIAQGPLHGEAKGIVCTSNVYILTIH